ncbi:MAG: N-6 DNA methylase [Candidatus Bipolaricaulis anaerobius]|nr:N-6 DNA methylase [Candidatus Bipolaricaulis anaerobius]MDD5764312.1 N-6 DNA methylase [Candidatus Bipolaricaulis anaerobius]
MAAPREVRTLIQRFQGNRAAYVSGPYNETQLRREFLDPLFIALGWDVANVSGAAEAYKDVVHEDAIKVSGATKAPDYCFRIGGTRKFFVEAKRPSVRIKDDASPAYQLRRYAWSAKLPLSILTTFAELSVYDCRVKPDKKDPASTARILYLTWEEYEPRWDELAGIFSKEAVYKGSFDRYAESTKKKRGTAEVDTAFLKEIEGWRDELARNIALRNPELSQRELNFAVQRTIDRIIFLRICEDRGIEEYGRLLALLNSQRVYPRLCQLFQQADERYNSGLFHFRPEKGRAEPPDELTLRLTIDDKVLKEIIRNLYYPDSPYEFSVLPVDILGQVYEQFLGKVIRLTPGHRAVVEDKPEVRKAGGIYYTPTYIVDYIVKNTVGELLKGKTPQEVGGLTQNWRPSKKLHPLRVLDPACGSGSFLLGAYQYLLDWYRDRYVEDGAEKHAKGRNPRLYRVGLPSPAAGRGFPRSPSPSGRGQGEGEWRLTTAERKRILLTHIYGVDIDPQAVEVTKLSLLLKVLEGETQETLDSFYRLFQERALPDLGNNIKCGNSLIGPDFYETAAAAGLDREELLQINPFDWHAEFPDVFPSPAAGRGARGEGSPLRGRGSSNSPSPLVGEGRGEGEPPSGFDAVIGNPPYVLIPHEAEKQYLKARYRLSAGKPDLYRFFIEQSLSLTRQGGRFGFIVPNTVLTIPAARPLRKYLLDEGGLAEIVVFWGSVFPGASVNSAIIVAAKGSAPQHVQIVRDTSPSPSRSSLGAALEMSSFIDSDVWRQDDEVRFNVASTAGVAELIRKVQEVSVPLGELADYTLGMQVYHNSLHSPQQIANRVFHSCTKKDDTYWPASSGRNVNRYYFHEDFKEYVSYGEWCYNKPDWRFCIGPRILVREIPSETLVCAVSTTTHIPSKAVIIVLPRAFNVDYLLGIMNSRLIGFYVRTVGQKGSQRLFPRISLSMIRQLPIRTIDFSDPADKARHDKMVNLVQTMLDLHKQLAAAKTEHEKTALQRQIAATDHHIDQLVYELYGLTEEEIRAVNGSAG